MAGLACGEPSLVAWQELDLAAAAFMAIPDAAAVDCMRLLARQGIVGGESGVAGLAGCLLAAPTGNPGGAGAGCVEPGAAVQYRRRDRSCLV